MPAGRPGPQEDPLPHLDLLEAGAAHNFREVIAYRDRIVENHGLRLDVASVQSYIDDGTLTERADDTRNPLQTLPLLDAIREGRFGAVFGGGRRDEEKARAKERRFSLRDAFGTWEQLRQRPELWQLYNGRHLPDEHFRVFPCPTGPSWTSGSTSNTMASSCRRSTSCTGGRCCSATACGWRPACGAAPRDEESVRERRVRYRTVGDMSCTGAVDISRVGPHGRHCHPDVGAD
ncbi:Phosphoadenosine phosphosulfate reductase family protein [Micromonospora halophytica]|uniref:Phosphoadenosine phosphosulfate reductase family protein n=1 Tax=Micromonospora halophytica TaxID=47864 RepID=A0A1C5JFQ6_9ACTN|nr:phosphoadenosine phosphosulfate reductase family protein [Micromonospora halophytica]SCG69390.1 Phosphoadenosine phosphosulfate reductase family protein [Micromonospora halophytica]